MWSWWKICSLKALSAALLNSGNWALVSGTAAACQEALRVWGCCASAWACSRFFPGLADVKFPGALLDPVPWWGPDREPALLGSGPLHPTCWSWRSGCYLVFFVCVQICAQTRVACCVCLVDWRNGEEVGVTPEMGVQDSRSPQAGQREVFCPA